jgi:putative oxidoreductase
MNVWVVLDWVGRIGASLMFIDKGIAHLRKRVALTAYAQSKHVPAPELAVIVTGLMMLAGSALMVSNWHPHWGAALWILFLVPVAVLMHNYWTETDATARASQSVQFWKNMTLAIVLGLYIIQGHLYTRAH